MIPLLYTALYYRQDGPEMIGTLRAESPEREISIQQPEPLQKRSLWLSNIFFVGAVHLVAAIGAIYVKPSLKTVVFCLLCWQAAGIGVTMGYHRLWSHRTFEAHWSLRLILAILGSMAFQGSIRWWTLRHRLHHRFVDTSNDPHNVKRGLWFSHIGWIFEKVIYPKASFISLEDLKSDKIVEWQHRYFIPLAFLMAFAFPTLVCWLGWNDPWGGLIYGGFVTRLLIWHCVFSINSLAHFVGTQEFSKEISARGNWFLAFLTCGEGHHNFHHEFPKDYRNGIHWYDYDPTKWFISLSERLGLASKLRTVPSHLIEAAKLKSSKETGSNQLHELPSPKMTIKDFSTKVSAGEQLILLNGWVLDISSYLEDHPGGAEIIKEFIGKDATEAFNGGLNNHSQTAKRLAMKYRIAKIK